MRKNLRARYGQVVLLAIFVIVAGLILWKVPEWQTPLEISDDAEKSAQIENEFRKTLAQIILGVLLLGTLYVGWKRASAAERTVEVAQESQITERFTRAIEQLGSDKMAIRLGGIYALERIAKDSEKDHWQVVEVLTAYVRKNSRSCGNFDQPRTLLLVKTDIQAILEVLGRRNTEYENPKQRLNLRMTDLRGAELEGAVFRRANLGGADLHNVIFERADLRGAFLFHANLTDAVLDGADLRGADLRVVWNFTQYQLASAIYDKTTKLPEHLVSRVEG